MSPLLIGWLFVINLATADRLRVRQAGGAPRRSADPRADAVAAVPAGGFVGAWIVFFGMRHKTQHQSFWIVQTVGHGPVDRPHCPGGHGLRHRWTDGTRPQRFRVGRLDGRGERRRAGARSSGSSPRSSSSGWRASQLRPEVIAAGRGRAGRDHRPGHRRTAIHRPRRSRLTPPPASRRRARRGRPVGLARPRDGLRRCHARRRVWRCAPAVRRPDARGRGPGARGRSRARSALRVGIPLPRSVLVLGVQGTRLVYRARSSSSPTGRRRYEVLAGGSAARRPDPAALTDVARLAHARRAVHDARRARSCPVPASRCWPTTSRTRRPPARRRRARGRRPAGAWGDRPTRARPRRGPVPRPTQPAAADADDPPAWEVVARYDPSRSVRVVIP